MEITFTIEITPNEGETPLYYGTQMTHFTFPDPVVALQEFTTKGNLSEQILVECYRWEDQEKKERQWALIID